MSISETAELLGKDPNYDLITPNGLIRYFIVFTEAEEVRKLMITTGITRSERVKCVILINLLKCSLKTRAFDINIYFLLTLPFSRILYLSHSLKYAIYYID